MTIATAPIEVRKDGHSLCIHEKPKEGENFDRKALQNIHISTLLKKKIEITAGVVSE